MKSTINTDSIRIPQNDNQWQKTDKTIDIDGLHKHYCSEQHDMLVLLNAIWSSMDTILYELKNDENGFYEKQINRVISYCQALKNIIWLHFDELDNMKNITKGLYLNASDIYDTVLNAINGISSIIDMKEIEINVTGVKTTNFRHNTKSMTEALGKLLTIIVENAQPKSKIIITTGNQGGRQHVELGFTGSLISIDEWIHLIEAAIGKRIDIKRHLQIETRMAMSLVHLLLARQNMYMSVPVKESDMYVFRIIHQDISTIH